MRFRTTIELTPFKMRINHTHKGFVAGSCFSEHIGQRLRTNKYPVTVNPLGILFNPASLAGMLQRLEQGTPYEDGELIEHHGRWVCPDLHGNFSDTDREALLVKINRAVERGHDALCKSDYVIVTLGTAWVYRMRRTGKIVGNCHKLPPVDFLRESLTVSEIVSCFSGLQEGFLQNKRIIWTISPVRHLHDGLSGNSLSKAILRVAVSELIERYGREYYPAFEILTDDLRDYRFYDNDMVHPSATGIEYIWEHFVSTALDPQEEDLLCRLDSLRQAMEHRILNPGSAAQRDFFRRQTETVQRLQKLYPTLDFSVELDHFKPSDCL